MRHRRRLWLAAGWIGVAGLWILARQFPPDGTSRAGLGLFSGRFHPLIVHLPIALIALVPVFEILGRAEPRTHLRTAAGFVLGLACAGALGAAYEGWLLGWAGGYHGTTVLLHLYAGVWFATTAVLAASLRRFDGRMSQGRTWGYCAALLAALGTMTWASHEGGSLSHGPTYLTEYMPAPLRKLLRVAQAKKRPGAAAAPLAAVAGGKALPQRTVYAVQIKPLLDRSCVECHGPDKVKASLRLDSYASLMSGGDSGADVVPWDPAHSELIRRVTLPPDDDDFMPNNGKNLLSEADKALLWSWIAAGASDRQPLLTPGLK